ncbi:hypothetical protein BD779DRAFT_1649151 [Infundibulicybe gibba]|nr:hypothetical protein BD779DRAFT_1649151 [Infundibulicybe gibba]
MFRSTALISILVVAMSSMALASSSCVAFDTAWNLLAFGFNGKDYNAGTQDTWGSGTAADITTTGRPPFNGANTTCYLSQFTNAIYVMNADSANPSSIYLYDATAKSWSTQSVTTGSFDPSSFSAILDHDTNVFYALSKGEIFSLDMGLLKSANSTALSWTDVQKASFNTDGYQPVMALAQNHIHFLNVPGVPTGDAIIFVIHFSFMQPTPQSYGNFPAMHGQATSFFKDSGVQEEFAYIPDDASGTFVINVETNTTQALKGPTVKDPLATYFASTSALVQLSSAGAVSFLPYSPGSASNSAATWSVISKLPVASPSTPSASGSSASGTSSSSGTGAAKAAGATQSSTGGANGAVSGKSVRYGLAGALSVGIAAVLMI